MAVGSGPWGLEVDALAGSGEFARKTDGAGLLSGVLQPRNAEGPDLAREREGELGVTVEMGGNNVVCRTGAVATGGLVRGLCFEVDAVGRPGF
jgi:hypothetical protein